MTLRVDRGVAGARAAVALDVEMSPSLAPVIGAVIVRVKHLFDLGAAPDAVSALLAQDPTLAADRAPLARAARGGSIRRLRARGARRARPAGVGESRDHHGGTLGAGIRRPIATPYPKLNRLTPTRRSAWLDVAADEIAALGIVGSRARCLVALAQAVIERRVVLAYAANVEEQIESLMQLPGIGPWTAQYIAMRALRWPDAFPGGDLMLLQGRQGRPKSNCRSAPKAGGRGAPMPLIISGNHIGVVPMNHLYLYRKPDRPLLLTCDGEASDRTVHGRARPTAARPATTGSRMRARARCRRRCGSSRNISRDAPRIRLAAAHCRARSFSSACGGA